MHIICFKSSFATFFLGFDFSIIYHGFPHFLPQIFFFSCFYQLLLKAVKHFLNIFVFLGAGQFMPIPFIVLINRFIRHISFEISFTSNNINQTIRHNFFNSIIIGSHFLKRFQWANIIGKYTSITASKIRRNNSLIFILTCSIIIWKFCLLCLNDQRINTDCDGAIIIIATEFITS